MAILAVVTAIAICMVIVNDFGTRTSIDMLQARNNLDQMRAHFLARSSLNLTDLVLRLQKRVDGVEQLRGIQITDYADMFIAAFGGDAEQVEGAIGLSATDTKGLGTSIGTFGVRITPIDGKINVNCAAAQAPAQQNLVRKALQALLYPNAFDPVFEEEDGEGWRRDRATQIDAIIDYVDPNLDRGEARSGAEDYGYEGLRDQYKAKNGPIDSVAELKLVRGVDDRFWALFGSTFRVAGACKINLRAVDDPKILAAIITLAAKDNDPVARDLNMVWTIATLALKMKELGSGFQDTASFVRFVKDPAAEVAAMTGADSADGTTGAAPPPLIQLPPGLTGIELDQRRVDEIAAAGTLRVYDVEVYGEVTRGGVLNPLRRTIRGTWDQDTVLQQSRVRTKLPPGRNNGAWLYLREE
ncbi:MAG: general secretion pathway protein GspK [Myxococcales bacterium]|nr:general secretion pathway protein GspK [Myxococcales bacterium]